MSMQNQITQTTLPPVSTGQQQFIVEGPDGALVEFPAGTDTATMERAMQEHYGAGQKKMFEVQGPDGKLYEVEAPDMGSAAQAVKDLTAGPRKASTYEEIMAKSRELYESGDMYGAKRLARIAISRRDQTQEQSFGQKAKEFFLGDDDPTTQNTGEKIGSFLNKAGEAMTFGLIGDEADAAVAAAIPGGMGYDERLKQQRQQQEVFERDNPGAAIAADVAGGLTGAMLPFGAIGTLGRGASLGARVGASAGTGAGMGATYGFMEGEGAKDRGMGALTGGAIGGVAGAVVPAVGATVQRGLDGRAARKAIHQAAKNAPTTEALRAQAKQAYQAVDDAGLQIKPESFEKTRQRITQMLRDNTGFDELPGPGSLTPHAARASQVMQEASQQMAQEPTAALPFKALDQMRRQAGAAAGNFTNKADQRAGMEIIKGLDDFVQRLGPDDVAAGDAKALQGALPKARELWSRMSRSETIENAMEAGENYKSGSSSGIRNQFARILRSPKLSKGFTEAEKAAMRRVVNGSTSERLLNLLGGGLGQLGQIGVGAGVGGVPGAALGAMTGAVARKGSEAVSRKNAELVRALIANGGLETLPTASDGPRKLVESMLRRGAAESGQ
ncbi:hypothetical protein [Celeribacter halophilus]|uniref:hypothetical protein n=1 Tax=Celeribacter halophilus TaxID=576117 RepID=UPI003A940CE8